MKFKYLIIWLLFLGSKTLFAQSTRVDTQLHSLPISNFNPIKTPFRFSEIQEKNLNRLLRFSILTGFRRGVESSSGPVNFSTYLNKANGTSKIYMYNLCIQDMLTLGAYKANRVILEVKNPSRFRFKLSDGNREEWNRKNLYCYELLLPAGINSSKEILKSELSRLFNVKFGPEIRRIPILVLVRLSNVDRIRSDGKGESFYNLQGKLNNIKLKSLESLLNEAGFPLLIDETDYKALVDIDLHITPDMDLKSLKKELQRYDLDIHEEIRDIEMFVIRDLNI